MPIMTRAADCVVTEANPRKPLEHWVECASCRASGPAVLEGINCLEDWQTGRNDAVAGAKRAGFREVRDVEGGHFAEYLCPGCAGGLL